MRARDHGLIPHSLKTGLRNAITDVPGVTVGHVTLQGGGLNTGVTAVIPAPGNLFETKLTAAAEVINGFGKSVGIVQLQELGTLETPILLTNTFGVAACSEALIRRAIAQTPAIGRTTSTVNPVVGECNDGPLSDIQALAVTPAHAAEALATAGEEVAEGSVGAGTGMSCFGFKGGIGTASRRLRCAGGHHHLGALVLANFGRAGDLRLPDGRRADPRGEDKPEQGSIIVVLATDLPLDQRQLARVCRRAGAGIARLGAYWGHGSGDIVIGFTTANRIPQAPEAPVMAISRLADGRIDEAFRAACEATEEAVLNALCAATDVDLFSGVHRPTFSEWLKRG